MVTDRGATKASIGQVHIPGFSPVLLTPHIRVVKDISLSINRGMLLGHHQGPCRPFSNSTLQPETPTFFLKLQWPKVPSLYHLASIRALLVALPLRRQRAPSMGQAPLALDKGKTNK